MCNRIRSVGYWADYVDPCSGLPMLTRDCNKVYSEVDGMECHIVGTGELEQELRALARTLGVEDRVRFLGSIDDEALAALPQ